MKNGPSRKKKKMALSMAIASPGYEALNQIVSIVDLYNFISIEIAFPCYETVDGAASDASSKVRTIGAANQKRFFSAWAFFRASVSKVCQFGLHHPLERFGSRSDSRKKDYGYENVFPHAISLSEPIGLLALIVPGRSGAWFWTTTNLLRSAIEYSPFQFGNLPHREPASK